MPEDRSQNTDVDLQPNSIIPKIITPVFCSLNSDLWPPTSVICFFRHGAGQSAISVLSLVPNGCRSHGDWRGKLNWGGVVGFSARLVQVDSGSLIWAASANRNMAMTNSTAIAHAASKNALEDLIAKLGR